MQAQGSRAAGRPVRRTPVTTEHPLIRTHPVTGWKSLFFNPGFVTSIAGIPKTESDHIISYLNEVITTTQELHVRFQWQKNDVAFWDNRISVRFPPFYVYSTALTNVNRITLLHMALLLTAAMLFVLPRMANALSSIRLASLRKMTSASVMEHRKSIKMVHASPIIMTSSFYFSIALLMMITQLCMMAGQGCLWTDWNDCLRFSERVISQGAFSVGSSKTCIEDMPSHYITIYLIYKRHLVGL